MTEEVNAVEEVLKEEANKMTREKCAANFPTLFKRNGDVRRMKGGKKLTAEQMKANIKRLREHDAHKRDADISRTGIHIDLPEYTIVLSEEWTKRFDDCGATDDIILSGYAVTRFFISE